MRKIINSCFLLFFVIISVPLWSAPFEPEDIFKIHSVIEAQISPDGNYIAYTLNIPRPLKDGEGSSYRELYLYDLRNAEDRPFLQGKVRVYNIGWSPDSRYILFLAKIQDAKTTTLYRIPVDGGGAAPYIQRDEPILDWEYGPDGKNIAFISYEPRDSLQQEANKLGFHPHIYEEQWRHRNLYIYDTEKEDIRQITRNITVFDFTWHPDGKRLAIATAEKNLVDYRYMFKRLKMVDTESKEIKPLLDNPGKLGQFAFNPGGTRLAIISAININDPRDGSIFIIDIPNKKSFRELKNYSKDFKGTVTNIAWLSNHKLIYSADVGVETVIYELDLKKNRENTLLPAGKAIFSKLSLSSGRLAFPASRWNQPWELYLFNLKKKKLNKLTDHNEWIKERDFGKQEAISYNARDGLNIEGVLIYPVNYTSGKRYPLINVIHGGPESCFHNGWVTGYSRWGQIAASRGYMVFMPNYRGSTGRGDEFSMLDQKDLAGQEFEDILDGIDYLVNKGLVDQKRVGIGGGSYGGYLSAWAATKYSPRFAAAVVFVGISDQLSKRNTTDIPYEAYYVHWRTWTDENFELVWDRSPVKWASGSLTPTLILHGKEDPRVHPSQSLELYRKLKLHGKAPVRLIYYPGEGHGNRININQWDYILRTLRWFDTYLKDGKPATELPPLYPDYHID